MSLTRAVKQNTFYEVRQDHYLQGESFGGHGGDAALKLYHRINPGQLIPLSAVLQGGADYSVYSRTHDTDDAFQLPDSHVTPFARVGLRFAGKEPMLYPDLAVEVSIWFERKWRSDDSTYGYGGDRRVQPITDLYRLYAGLNYAWTNTGHQFNFGVTAGGSENADRSNAASAYVDSIPGLQRHGHWHTGVGPGLAFTSRSEVWRVILRYGYAFTALRDGSKGAQSVGALLQHNFERHKSRQDTVR